MRRREKDTEKKKAKDGTKDQQKHSNRSKYAKLRKKKVHIFSLRLRLISFVVLEILSCIILSYIIDLVLNKGILWLLNTYLFSKFLPFSITVPFPLILIPMCLIVGLVATLFLSIWFLAPIRRLKKAIEKIADGDFSVRLSTISTSKEIQEIYTGFNVMAEELESTEILQTDFVSNVSHEFKTPINAIEGYSMLLQDNDNLTDEQKEYVYKILFNTQRLSTLTGSILLLSKIENQSITTDKAFFRLDEQIREVIVTLEPVWEKKNIYYDVEMDDIEYFGSEKLTYHVWSNLIGNALKFGPACGTVRIRLTDDKKNIYFTVEDEGEGLSEDAMKHIFDKFYQGDSSHKAEGNGLGLTLVKKILLLEDGTISAENREEGGCRFTVTLKKTPDKKKNSKNQ